LRQAREGMVEMGSQHSLGRETFHYLWNRNHKPVLRIAPGDEVSFDINDVWSWGITRDTTSEDLKDLDNSKLYPLSGPVYVEGAQPGDTLTVDVLEVKNDDFGWSAIAPDLGILEEFKDPYLYKWELKDPAFAHFEKGIKIPVRPFCGVMGVAPPETGGFEVMPPGRHGGNMDIKHLTAGSRLELPVWVEGALFSTGDVHAAMGDGEVCVTAIECAGHATFRFGLVKRTGLAWPRYSATIGEGTGRDYHVTTGIAPDLMEAAKGSVRNMLDFLTKTYGLRREDAYVLCSVAADLRIHEVVDKPNWVVGAMIPKDIFPA
jgi:acetamidase/formamidase